MITAERLATQERAWGLLEDLRLLSRFRRWYLTDFPEDIKITFLQWSLNFLLLSEITTGANMYFEAQAIFKEYGIKLNKANKPMFSDTYQQAKNYANGESIDIAGITVPGRFIPDNTSLIELFTITPTELAKLPTLGK